MTWWPCCDDLCLVDSGQSADSTPRTQSERSTPSAYMSVNEEPFDAVRAQTKKSRVMAGCGRLLEARYNLSRRVDENVRMTRGSLFGWSTARLKEWRHLEQLGRMSPDEIRTRGYFRTYLCRCQPFVARNVFPQTEIKACRGCND